MIKRGKPPQFSLLSQTTLFFLQPLNKQNMQLGKKDSVFKCAKIPGSFFSFAGYAALDFFSSLTFL